MGQEGGGDLGVGIGTSYQPLPARTRHVNDVEYNNVKLGRGATRAGHGDIPARPRDANGDV